MEDEATRQGTPFNKIYRRAKLLEKTTIFSFQKGEEEELLEMAALRGVDEAHEVNIMKYSSELYRISS